MTHLKAQAAFRDEQGRLQWKLGLVKMLYRKGYSREAILDLFRFIDWLLVLPEELERTFLEAVRQYEEEIKMPYVTSVERMGIQQGIQQGILDTLHEGIIEILEVRFERVPDTITRTVGSINDPSSLKILHKKAAAVASLDEFDAALNNPERG